MTAHVCACVIGALVELAPQPHTERGRYYVCRRHGQMVIWSGRHWRWSNEADDIRQLPRTAECAAGPEPPH